MIICAVIVGAVVAAIIAGAAWLLEVADIDREGR